MCKTDLSCLALKNFLRTNQKKQKKEIRKKYKYSYPEGSLTHSGLFFKELRFKSPGITVTQVTKVWLTSF